MNKPFFINMDDVEPYSPANHEGTSNYRVISNDTVGAKNVEVLIGVIEKNQGALQHSHPDLEQVCYLMEGTAVAEVGGQKKDMKPGDFCFFPANEPHILTATSDTPVKLLVIYSPPYGEDPEKVVR